MEKKTFKQRLLDFIEEGDFDGLVEELQGKGFGNVPEQPSFPNFPFIPADYPVCSYCGGTGEVAQMQVCLCTIPIDNPQACFACSNRKTVPCPKCRGPQVVQTTPIWKGLGESGFTISWNNSTASDTISVIGVSDSSG
jgi:hypothetical protein